MNVQTQTIHHKEKYPSMVRLHFCLCIRYHMTNNLYQIIQPNAAYLPTNDIFTDSAMIFQSFQANSYQNRMPNIYSMLLLPFSWSK